MANESPDNRLVLLAVDGSVNSERAFHCKFYAPKNKYFWLLCYYVKTYGSQWKRYSSLFFVHLINFDSVVLNTNAV